MRCSRARSPTMARMAAVDIRGVSSDDGASGLLMRWTGLGRARGRKPVRMQMARRVLLAAPRLTARKGAANPQQPCAASSSPPTPTISHPAKAFSRRRRAPNTSLTATECAPMAMTMNGEVQLSAPRDKVWAMPDDPEVLKACIPGCEQLDKSSDTEFQAVATLKVGPVKARWKGKVRLLDLDPPNSYRISGEGEGGVAGFAKGNAKVSLSDKDGGTLLSYDVEAQIGGKLAQLGQRLINSAAKKTADDFFVKFATAVAG